MINTLSLVQFQTQDQIRLSGLLYEPPTKTNRIIINLHGNGSGTLTGSPLETNQYAHVYTHHNYAYLAFANRGSGLITSFQQYNSTHGIWEKIKCGTAYELIQDAPHDINASISFAKSRGYSKIYLSGHSTGANKIVYYNSINHNNPVGAYILLGGADDTGIYYSMLGKEEYSTLLALSKQKIAHGYRQELLLHPIIGMPMSYQSLYDTLNPDGNYNIFPFNQYRNNLKLSTKPLFQEYKTIQKPTLILYGENDAYCTPNATSCLEILKNQAPQHTKITYDIIKNADHSFADHATTVANKILQFLTNN